MSHTLMTRIAIVAFVLISLPLSAQETLTLATPETINVAATWQVRKVNVDADAPNIEVSLRSNTGAIFVWRLVVCEVPDENCDTLTVIRNAVKFINNGDFAVKLKKTLNRWILDELVSRGVKPGTVGGTPE